jgi:hypothetical protein
MVRSVEDTVEREMQRARERESGVVQWKSRTDRAEMIEWVKVLLTRLEPFLQRHVLPFDYDPEYKFRVPLRLKDPDGNDAQIDLVGGMDIRVRETLVPEPVWVGFDLKATASPDYIRKTLGQGIFYSLAHFAEKGAPFSRFAFLQPMVEDNPFVWIDITQEDLSSMLSRIQKMAHDMWRNDITPKKLDSGCAWCPVKPGCSRFKPGGGGMFAPKARSSLAG